MADKKYKINVTIGSKTDELKAGLGKAADQLKAFSASAAKVGAAIAAIGVASGAVLFKVVKDTAAYGDSFSKLSDRLGISAQKLQEYAFVAEHAGVNQEQLNIGIQTGIRNMANAARGIGEAKDAISALGISLKDQNGQVRSSTELFEDAISKLAGVTNETERLGLASKIFGEGGVRLNQILAMGSDEIERLKQRAHDLGIVMSDDAIAASVRFTDALADTKFALKGLRNELGSELLPKFADGLEIVNEWIIKNKDEIIALGKVIVSGIGEAFIKSIDISFSALDTLYGALQRARAGMALMWGQEDQAIQFAADYNKWNDTLSRSKKLIDDLAGSLSKMSGATTPPINRPWSGLNVGAGTPAAKPETTTETPMVGILGPDPQEYRDLLAQYQADHAKLMAQLTNDEDAQFAIQLEELARNYQERLGLGMEFEEAAAAMSEEYATQKAERDRERELESLRDKYGRLADFLSETQSMTQIMGDTMAQTFEAVASQVGNLIADGLFGEIKDVNKAITEMFRNLLKMILQTIAQLLILKALKAAFGGPLGFLFHEGGIVGVSGMPRHHGGHSPSWMAGAPRHHTGLAPDERYAILQTREAVLNRRAVEGIGPESVAFMNRFGRLPSGGGSPTVIVNVHSADPRTWIRTEFATEYKSAKSAGYL